MYLRIKKLENRNNIFELIDDKITNYAQNAR